MVKNELKECGMMPPLPPMPPGPPMAPGSSPCAMAAAPAAAGMPPEGSDEATFANEVADLVADIVYNVLMSKVTPEVAGHDCATEHPGESHEFWEIKNMFKKAGIDSVLNEGKSMPGHVTKP